LPSYEEIESALKYLKNNKTADSIAVKLLNSDHSQLVDVLEEVIQLAWTIGTLPESWTKVVLCPVYKMAINSIAPFTRYLPAERCIQVFAKVLYDLCYPTRTRSFSITKLGSSQTNQRQTNSLHCAKY
jgi:hypothetical protein